MKPCISLPLRWRHNERDGVVNHQPHDCLLKRLFRHRSKKTLTLRITGLYEGNSSVTSEFPAHKASIAEKVSIWWCNHALVPLYCNNDLHQFNRSQWLWWAEPFKDKSKWPAQYWFPLQDIEKCSVTFSCKCPCINPDSKIHAAYMGPVWGRQNPGGPYVDPMNLHIREDFWKGHIVCVIIAICPNISKCTTSVIG